MNRARWQAVTALAVTQHGLVTTAQTRDLGLRADAVQRAVGAGLLTRSRRGVLRVAGAPPTPWEGLMAACLAAGPDAVAARRSAGTLYGLAVAAPPQPEIVCGDQLADGLAGTLAHRSRRLPPEHRTVVDGVPCTTVERTIIDLAALLTRPALTALVDDADRRRLCRPVDIDVCLCTTTTRGRAGVATLRLVLADRVGGASALEATWLRHLRDGGLPAPELQHQVLLGGRVLLLDAAWPAPRVTLEVNGWDAHRTRGSFDADAERFNLLIAAGWRIVQATSRSEPARVVAQLRHLLAG